MQFRAKVGDLNILASDGMSKPFVISTQLTRMVTLSRVETCNEVNFRDRITAKKKISIYCDQLGINKF